MEASNRMRWLMVVAAVAAAFGLRYGLEEQLSRAPFLVFILAVTLSAWYGGWWPGVAATVASLGLGNYFFSEPRYSLLVADDSEFVMSLVFGGEGLLISWLSERRLAGLRRAHELTKRLRYLAWELTVTEQQQRRELAQVLHDHVQQLLVGAMMKLSIFRRRSTQDAAQEASLAEIEDLLRESLHATRSMTAELSPRMLYAEGLVPALRVLVEQFRDRHHLNVDLHAEQEQDLLSDNGRTLMFQIVRELLFNTVKHAGTDRASVHIGCDDGRMRVVVSDDGRGYDPRAVTHRPPQQGGFGLFSIRERLLAAGGTARFESAPGKGSTVTLTLPLDRAVPQATPPSHIDATSSISSAAQP